MSNRPDTGGGLTPSLHSSWEYRRGNGRGIYAVYAVFRSTLTPPTVSCAGPRSVHDDHPSITLLPTVFRVRETFVIAISVTIAWWLG